MNIQDRFDHALSASEPSAALTELATRLKAEGMDQLSMYRLFEEYLRRVDGDDPRYDAIADTMDLIWGGPWAKGRAVFDTELSLEEE